MPRVVVELFASRFCANCTSARATLDDVVAMLGKSKFEVRYIDVVEAIDHAVALGVLATPAIAVDGELKFTGIPRANELQAVLAGHMGSARLRTREI